MENRNQHLYQQLILDHNKNPCNFKDLKEHTHCSEGYNPLCGDHIWIYMSINKQDEIEEISFQGQGCAICKASASIMTTTLQGKKISFAKDTINQFQHLLKGDKMDDEYNTITHNKRLMVFSEVWKYPSRIKCAALPWYAAASAIKNDNKPISTE